MEEIAILYAYKKGNVLIGAMIFLFMATMFSSGVYKIIKIKTRDRLVFKIDNSALMLGKEVSDAIEEIQGYVNRIENIELEQEYRNNGIGITFKEEGETKIFLGKVELDVEFLWKKESICSCENKECVFKKERIILIPKREVIDEKV